MKKCEVINTNLAPRAIGPYSQAIRTGDLVYTSGQLGIDPATGKLVEGGCENQARQVLENLSQVLEAAGSDMSLVIKSTIFIKNMDEFPLVNKIYGEYFTTEPPSRSTVEVARLPLGALIEIEMVAMTKEA